MYNSTYLGTHIMETAFMLFVFSNKII